jgi:tetratricopeptide (TPR) repeat protein
MSSPAEAKSSNAAQAKSALLRIGLAAAVLIAIFIAYSKYMQTSQRLKALRDKVVELMKHDSAKDYATAAKQLDEGLAIRSNDPFFVSTRAEVASILWVEEGEAKSEEAAKKFSAQAAAAGINSGSRFSAEALTLIAEGKLEEADAQLKALVAKGITEHRIIGSYGAVHLREGNLDQAKLDYKQIQDIYPRYGASFGETLFLTGEISAAQGALQHTLEGSPNYVRAQIAKARADVARDERVAEAQKLFDDLLASGNEDLSPTLKSRVLAGRAEVQLALAKPVEAEKAARAAIDAGVALDPQLALAYYDLGLALAQQKKAGALEAFQGAIKQFKYVGRVYFQGALALATAGRVADGESLLNAYTAGGLPQNDAYHLAKGDFLFATDKVKQAGDEFDAAIKANALNADAYFKKGRVVQALAEKQPLAEKHKSFNTALELYASAIDHRARFPDAYRQQGIIFLEAGDEKAIEKFGKALQLLVEAHASKAVQLEFLTDTAARSKKAGGKFKSFAADLQSSISSLK